MRWLRGSASDLIFSPWASSIERNGGRILGGKRVSGISFGHTAKFDGAKNDKDAGIGGGEETRAAGEGKAVVETNDGTVFEADAVVLAVGISAAKVRTPFEAKTFSSSSFF